LTNINQTIVQGQMKSPSSNKMCEIRVIKYSKHAMLYVDWVQPTETASSSILISAKICRKQSQNTQQKRWQHYVFY